MTTDIQEKNELIYETITGGRIVLSKLTDAEFGFLELITKKYGSRQEWTRFAAWWNAKFNASGLSTSSVVFRICQDLEARLGINQRKVSLPDYRDFLAELIDTRFGSRQGFCKATDIDPGQLSRVLANRADLSMKLLQKVLNLLDARLVIQTEEQTRAQSSIDRAAQAIAAGIALRDKQPEPALGGPPMTCLVPSAAESVEDFEKVATAWEREFPNVPNLQQVAARAQVIAQREMPLMFTADAA